jgi:hypothetical protein
LAASREYTVPSLPAYRSSTDALLTCLRDELMDRRQPSSPFWTPKTHGAFSGRHHLAVPMFATPLLRSSPSPACALAQARAFAQPLIASDEVCHERGAWTSGWSQGMKWSQETRAAARTAAVPVVVRSAVRYGNGASSAARRVRSYYRRYAPTGDLQWVVDRSPHSASWQCTCARHFSGSAMPVGK